MLLRWPLQTSVESADADVDGASDARKSNPVDVRIGSRVRLKRRATGLSLSQMSGRLGLSEALLSEYERGTTRIDAGDLVAISRLLGERPSYFFDNGPLERITIPDAPGGGEMVSDVVVDLARLFAAVKDPGARRKILDFAAELSRAKSAPQ